MNLANSHCCLPNSRPDRLQLAACILAVVWGAIGGATAQAQPTEGGTERIFNSRPTEKTRKDVGHIGPTGIHVFIHPGLKVTVEQITPGSPAEGKFKKGDVIVGVNGTPIAGHNVFVLFGNAITEAEADDGKIVFDIQSGGASKQVTVTIPALGKYSDTWPINCPKSQKIVEQAAAFYHDYLKQRQGDVIPGTKDEGRGIPGALICLFLLSTGDDAHLPVVRGYFEPFIANPQGIGEHTWNNGYNGIACGEYYLRTGDKDVLPVLQAFVDDAARRQKFDAAWPHWGDGVNPRYVAGGLMNAASVQVLTTMLLAKECGVDVDDQTLNNSLKFYYRFVGHGTVPYGDHRSEGGLASNGKDGMLAAAMQVATAATSDTTIYQTARDYSAMGTLKSYPGLATGHGDNGRGDGIWRGITASLLMEKKSDDYRAMMDHIKWWLDLSRFHTGAVGMATVGGFNDLGSGAAVAMTYTAHLRQLRICGATRSQYAVDFQLPEYLWGRPADRVFHGIEFLPEYHKLGSEQPPHKLLAMLGNAYRQVDPADSFPEKKNILQSVYHHRYMFRSQAAKVLRKAGDLAAIEQMLEHADPRVRRAGLDGITDWRYWFAMGKQPMRTEQYTPSMIESIGWIIADPDEALYVIEGALFAMHHMPAEAIARHKDNILPWTTHEEWWLRHGAFMALQGLEKDKAMYLQVLPTLIDMYVNEYHTMPRNAMQRQLANVLKKQGTESEAGQMILAGFERAAGESRIKPGLRTREGSYNAVQGAKQAIRFDPAAAVPVAQTLSERFDLLDTARLLELVAFDKQGREGLYPVLAELSDNDKQALTDVLYGQYLPELTQRLKAETRTNLTLIDTVLTLKQLKEDVSGWHVIGAPAPAKRQWRYVALDPIKEQDEQPRRERKRFRQITLPESLVGWYKPGYDDSKWNVGKAPIGDGVLERRGEKFENQSKWPDGEFLLARTTFEVDSLGYDLYRLSILNNQGFDVYLNGEKISTYIWWNDKPRYWKRNLGPQDAKLLQQGTNTIAVYTNVEYPSAMKPHRWDRERLGQIDCYIEGLRKEELY